MSISLTIADAAVPYLVLLFNCLLFTLLRANVRLLLPTSVHLLLNELISTVELCADCAELGVVWEVHGNVGLSVALFLLCCWWGSPSFGFGDAEACPCGPIEECLLLGRAFTEAQIAQKLAGQLAGAYLTWKYTTSIWCWHLSEQHMSLHASACQATLFVSPLYGAAIEGLITFISRIVALQSADWTSERLALLVNAAVTVLLVLFALNTTGGYFNPIMASALSFGCEGNTLLEHLSVYWVGALLGGLLARYCHEYLLGASSSSAHSKVE